MGEKRGKSKFFGRIRRDYNFRTFIFASFSFFATVAFAFYNAFLFFAYQAVWNLGITVYYLLLLAVRAYVIFSEAGMEKRGMSESEREKKRVRLFLNQSVLLFFIDFALVAPISLMVLEQKAVNYSLIPAIAMAAYTTYKVILSAKSFVKTRRGQQLSVTMLRSVSFVDALVSVLSLQYTLIMTVDGAIVGDMFVLCAVSSFAFWIALVAISVFTLIGAVKKFRSHKTQ